MNSLDRTEDYYRVQQKLATVNKQLEEANATLKVRTEQFVDVVNKLAMVDAKLDEALARIKASQEQEPIAWCYGVSDGDTYGVTLYKDNPALEPLFSTPIISPTEAELRAANDKIEATANGERHKGTEP